MSRLQSVEQRTSPQGHWNAVYQEKDEAEVSWFQERPTLSLELIEVADPSHRAHVIDIGGGASRLVDHLLAAGYRHPAVLDIAGAALARARERLGASAGQVEWIVADVTRTRDIGQFDLWHDRAVFHFLTDAQHRRRYLELAEGTVAEGGHLVIATFAPDGPERCSGMPVCRYDAEALSQAVGRGFELQLSQEEEHRTPGGAAQRFVYCLFRRIRT